MFTWTKTLIFVLLLLICPTAFSQQSETLSVADPRPVSNAIDILAKKYGWIVTYEDPPYLYAADIDQYMHVPLGGRFRITYGVSPKTLEPDEAQVLQSALDAARQSTGVVFAMRKGAHRIHIVPVKARDASGKLVDVVPILDTRIDAPAEQGNALAALSGICQTLSRMTGERVIVGTTPLHFERVPTHISGENRPAREVLSSLLDSVAPSLSWSLYYDPGDHDYALNIDVVKKSEQ